MIGILALVLVIGIGFVVPKAAAPHESKKYDPGPASPATVP
jgi:hypothetical protein